VQSCGIKHQSLILEVDSRFILKARWRLLTATLLVFVWMLSRSSLAANNNQSAGLQYVDNDVITTKWVRPMSMHHLESHASTRYLRYSNNIKWLPRYNSEFGKHYRLIFKLKLVIETEKNRLIYLYFAQWDRCWAKLR